MGLSHHTGWIMVSKPPYHQLHKHEGRGTAKEAPWAGGAPAGKGSPGSLLCPRRQDRASGDLFEEQHGALGHTTQMPLAGTGVPEEGQYYQFSGVEGVQGWRKTLIP